MGVAKQPQSVTFNGAQLSSGWEYNPISKVLAIMELNNVASIGAWSAPWKLVWDAKADLVVE